MARDFKTIGVVGLGTMGAGITEVFARNGYAVVGVEVDDDAVARGRQHLEHSTGARGLPRQAERGGREGAARPGHLRHLAGGAQGRRPRGRGGRGVASRSRSRSSSSSTDRLPRTPSSPPTPPRSRSPRSPPPTPSPGRVIGVHFFNPAPVQGFVEIVQTVVTEPSVLEDVSGAGAGAGQEPGRLRRQGRLHRQHAAVRLPQPRGVACTSSATPPARTSTRPCGSAAATRWARWPCST